MYKKKRFLELIQKMYTKMKNINKEESNQENNVIIL